MRLFPAKQPLECVSVDLLGPLQNTKAGNRFNLVMTSRFMKLTEFVLQKHIAGLDVAKEFLSHWVFIFWFPKEILLDNQPQFASKIYQNTSCILGILNIFT